MNKYKIGDTLTVVVSHDKSNIGIVGRVADIVDGDRYRLDTAPQYYFEENCLDRAVFREVFFSDEVLADKWYKAKLQFITIDEKSGKEKRTAVAYLVQAASFDKAIASIDEVMGGTMIDYEKPNITDTKIMDVFLKTA